MDGPTGPAHIRNEGIVRIRTLYRFGKGFDCDIELCYRPRLLADAGERRARLTVQLRWLDILATVVQLGIPWGAACFIAYMVFRSVDALAGKVTLAELGANLVGNVRINEAVAWILASLFGLYGLNERRLRRKHIERLAPQISELESRLDPNRTSSRLTPRGTTRPEDRR
jgi:hypothetical protein